MVDQQKTNSLPIYGNNLVKTPNLVDLSSNGTIFKNNDRNSFLKNFDVYIKNSKNSKIVLENLKLS